MNRPAFEEHWRRRFTQRGLTQQDDAGIAGWSETGLQTRMRAFRRVWGGGGDAAGLWADVGCGAGTYTRFLAEQGLAVLGMDYSAPSVCKARERSPQVSGWLVGDATRLPLAARSLDGVLCFGVLQALSSPDKALSELAATLKPGGCLWVDALNARCLPHRVKRLLRRPQNLRYDRAADLLDRLRAQGLDASLHWVPILPARLQALQPLLESRFMRAVLKAVPPLAALLSHSMLIVATRPASQDGGAR
ncbi:MAG: class I SAM-dependent methyltransferase [Rhodocyclaceae bacterium]